MTECHCELCKPDDPAPTFTELWRIECEARNVLTWSLDERRRYLSRVLIERGIEATDNLKAEILRQHERNKNGR